MSGAPGADLRIAAVHLARTRVIGGTIHVVGDSGSSPAVPTEGVRHVAADGAVSVLRSAVTTGDAVVVLGAFADREQLLARLPAWGVVGVWLGQERRPVEGLATVCVPGDPAQVLPDLLERADRLRADPLALAPAVVECTDEVCVTCSDEGRLGGIVSSPATVFAPAIVRTAAGEEEVDVTVLGHVRRGDLVLIHAGMGIALVPVPPAAAAATLTEELTAS